MTVQNLDRLKRKFALIPERAIKQIQAAIELGAQDIVGLAKSLVPVHSGKLRNSIGWTWGGQIPKGAIAIAGAAAGGLTATVFAGNDEAFYARWVEFGTVRVRAQPYFFPAYRANRKSVKRRISTNVRKAIKSVAGNV